MLLVCCGELLKQIAASNGNRTDLQPCKGDHTNLTRGFHNGTGTRLAA